MIAVRYPVWVVALFCLAALAGPGRAQDNQPAKMAHLLAQMQSASPSTREAAAKQLEAFADDDRVVTAMIAACADASPAVRKYAAITLGKAGDPRGITALCPLLKDDNENIQSAAFSALEEIGDARALPALLALVQGPDAGNGEQAIQAIGRIGGEQAAQALLAIARDADNPRRDEAIEQLGFLHDARVMDIILPDLQAGADRGVEAAGQIGDPRSVAPLLALLARPKSHIDHNGLLSALGKIGDARAVDAAIAALQHGNPHSQERVFAAQALAAIGDAKAIPALVAALAEKPDAPGSVRDDAMYALSRFHTSAARDALLPLLREPDENVHMFLLLALGAMHSTQVYDALAAEMPNTTGPMHDAVLYALAQTPDPHAVLTVIAQLKTAHSITSSGWSMRDLGSALAANPAATPAALIQALDIDLLSDSRDDIQLALLHSDDPRALPAVVTSLSHDTLHDTDPRVLEALQGRREEVYTQLTALFATAEDRHKGAIIKLLGQLGDPRAVPLLLKLPDNFWTRDAVLPALGELKAREALPKLLDAARHPEDDQHCAAGVRGLGALGDISARDAVWAVYQTKPTDVNAETRQAALLAAAQLGDPRAVEPVIALLRAESYDQQQLALRAIAVMPDDPRLAAALAARVGKLAYFPHDSPAPLRAALARYHTPDVDAAMIHRLNHVEYQEDFAYMARALAPLLAARKNRDAVPALMRNLYLLERDAGARQIVVQALAQIGDPRAVLPCLHALRDADQDVAATAAGALATLTGQDFGANHAKWVEWWLNKKIYY